MKAIIFDMDGVLIDSMKCPVASWQKAFEKFDIQPTNEELYYFEGMSSKETIDIISKRYDKKLSKSQKEIIYNEKKIALKNIFELNLYEGVLEILKLLKTKGIKLCVVTGSNREFTNSILTEKFHGIFDFAVTGDDVVKGKPDPESYQKAKLKFNIASSQILVIENAPLGIESAKKAHLKVLAIETTLNKTYLNKADIILKNHSILFDYLKKELTFN